ncbi:MAG: serine/threonine protein kinase [Bacteroidetes bacterium]|nr:serine/threonine protein kinase [Bacteroidota bacterium]
MQPSEFTSNKSESPSSPVLIGHGGTCELYRIMIHNKFHVLKRHKKENTQSPQYIESLNREFAIGFQLDHPNIVRYLKYGIDDDGQFILLEFIDGASITEVINKQAISLSVDAKKNIVIQLCGVIEYLHSKQIYHLDIKPDNLLITFRGKNLKLIDFGHAVSDGDINVIGGTKTFMPPEQSENKYNTTNDIYSIGKVIEFLFSNEQEIDKSIWLPIIQKCLAIEPNDRYHSVSNIVEAIETKKKSIASIYFISLFILLSLIVVVVWNFNSGRTNKEQKIVAQPMTNIEDTIKLKSTTPSEEVAPSKIKKSPIKVVSFTQLDSNYCTNLGLSLFKSFVAAYDKSDKSMKTGSAIQTQITDSIQNEWFIFSSKYSPESVEYKWAYDCYFPNFTLSQKKIMDQLFGSK